MSGAVSQLKQIVEMTREISTQFFPGSVIPFEMLDYSESQDGFGLSRGSGAALLYGDVTNAQPDSWNLQVTAAIAFEVPHRPEIGMVLNEWNYQAVLGKFYYRVTPDRSMSAVMWEMCVWSRLLNDFSGVHGQRAIQWIGEIVREALTKSSEEAATFVQQFGGRVPSPTEQDLTNLFMASNS